MILTQFTDLVLEDKVEEPFDKKYLIDFSH